MAWWGKQLRKSLKSLSQFQCYFIPILAKEILAFPENLTFIWENWFFFFKSGNVFCVHFQTQRKLCFQGNNVCSKGTLCGLAFRRNVGIARLETLNWMYWTRSDINPCMWCPYTFLYDLFPIQDYHLHDDYCCCRYFIYFLTRMIPFHYGYYCILVQ